MPVSASNPQSLVDRVAARRRQLMRWLALANVGVALLLVGLVLSVLTTSKRSYEMRARDMAEGLAAIAQLNIASELSQVDAVLRATLDDLGHDDLLTRASAEDIGALLAGRFRLLKGVDALRLADARGVVRWSSPPGADISVADRPYFGQAAQQDSDEAIVSGPFRSKVSGRWVLAVVRPVRLNGRFAGTLHATLAVDHFAQVFERYDLGTRDAMALRTQDLRLVARRSPGSASQGDTGTRSVSQELREAVAARPAGGTFVSRVVVDGEDRTTAYRAVAGWPLIVFAGVSNDRYFQPWWQQVWSVCFVAALAWSLIVMATVAVYRCGVREAGAMQAIAAHAQSQRQSQERISALLQEQTAMLNNDLVGMLKLEQRLITWKNRAFEAMLGYEPGELEGRPMRALYVDEDEYDRVGREAYPALATGANCRLQVRMRRKSGQLIWVDLNGVRLTETETFWMAVDVTAMRQAHDSLTHAAFHDALTQLPNRARLLDRLQQSLAVARDSGEEVAVCYLDLDGFKAVNDELGHDAGDALLVEVAQRMARQVRSTDTVARIGGDEFVVVLGPMHGDDWRRVLDRVVAAVNEPVSLYGGRPVRVGASVGVATQARRLHDASALGAADAADLLIQADQAMLAAKRAGKGRWRLADGAPPMGPRRAREVA